MKGGEREEQPFFLGRRGEKIFVLYVRQSERKEAYCYIANISCPSNFIFFVLSII